jgi:hypothetical protein
VAIAMLDGLATIIRFRLSSRACEGACAGAGARMVGVGGDKPQYRVGKSTRFRCGHAGLVLAVLAGDEAA